LNWINSKILLDSIDGLQVNRKTGSRVWELLLLSAMNFLSFASTGNRDSLTKLEETVANGNKLSRLVTNVRVC
jgi:hypothetical protein